MEFSSAAVPAQTGFWRWKVVFFKWRGMDAAIAQKKECRQGRAKGRVCRFLQKQVGTIHTDELDLHRLDHTEILRYASEFPAPVKQKILQAVATLKTGQTTIPLLH